MTLDPGIKNVVVGDVRTVLETSRAQDRIVVYFGGHAIEKGVRRTSPPIEGDLETTTGKSR